LLRKIELSNTSQKSLLDSGGFCGVEVDLQGLGSLLGIEIGIIPSM
jgi:hypothetical protein